MQRQSIDRSRDRAIGLVNIMMSTLNTQHIEASVYWMRHSRDVLSSTGALASSSRLLGLRKPSPVRLNAGRLLGRCMKSTPSAVCPTACGRCTLSHLFHACLRPPSDPPLAALGVAAARDLDPCSGVQPRLWALVNRTWP
jgi:hypothetical protein